MKFIITFTLIVVSIQYGFSQCPKAQEYIDKVKDANENWTPDERVRNNCPQVWSQLGAWHVLKCQSEKGVASVEDAKRLVGTMNATRNNIMNMGSGCGTVPPLMTVDQVKIIGDNSSSASTAGSNSTYSDPNAQLKSATVDFMNLLVNETDDERIKQISKNLNNTREWVDAFKQIDPENVEGFDKIEDVSMLISGLAGLFFKPSNNEAKREYRINGERVLLTNEEAKQYDILITPYSYDDMREFKKELDRMLGVNELLDRRRNIFLGLSSTLHSVSIEKYIETRTEIYVNYIKGDTSHFQNSVNRLFNLFEDDQTVTRIEELEEFNKQIEELLMQEALILKELFLNGIMQVNDDSWSKEKIINLYRQNAILWHEKLLTDDYQLFFDIHNRIIPIINVLDYPELNCFQINNQKDKIDLDYLPISIFHFSLSNEFDFMRNVYYMNLNWMMSKAGKNNFETIYVNKGGNFFDFRGEQQLLLNDDALVYNSYYDSLMTDDISLTLQNIKNGDINQQKTLKNKFGDLWNMNIHFMDVNALEEYQVLVQNSDNWTNEDFCKARKKAGKFSQIEMTKNQKKVFGQELKFNFALFQDFLIESDLYKNNFGLADLKSVDRFITYLEMPFSNSYSVLDWLHQPSDSEMCEQTLNHPYQSLDCENGKLIDELNQSFMRFYLYRYYLEKKNGLSIHTESDKKLIKDNLFAVLNDFICHTNDMEPAQFVLKDIGIIE